MSVLNKRMVIQLVALAIVGVAAIVYVGLTYARIGELAGIDRYTVHADFSDSGGIFVNAEVTYQGVPVGRVRSLELRPGGVRVNLSLDSAGPAVPASAQAVVANRSAIGEQFVDLRPASAGGPTLVDGSLITDTSTPRPVQDVIASAVAFTDSLPLADLKTVITELGKAFNGNGESLSTLIDSLSQLAKSGHDNLAQTVSLLRHANTALATQADQADPIGDWASNLNLISAQLASSDPAIRRLLTTGTASATQLAALLQRSGGDATTVIRHLATDVRNIKPTFVTTSPVLAIVSGISSGSFTPAPGDGTVHFGIVLETNNPPACTLGYESTQAEIAAIKKKNPSFDLNYDDFPFNPKANCKIAQGNPTAVRRAQNARYADPAMSQPWDNNPKKDPDKLNLNPIATQLAALLGITRRAG
ncbi:MCE family protein [Williamsia maris]|uniref:Phospholipid/cholesterol/gamma-HCH transport system substrate-binding protein n=1 Tax=Williamsia maris TaxID=72806 RepID=A0ABT1HJH2_9NOCA|nr:MCE family protein [Williamsia maris]MCP2178077.1 phospholipid/cholesterol/gamma-HCH transport system substrate-binding protein [Williamsia maris]